MTAYPTDHIIRDAKHREATSDANPTLVRKGETSLMEAPEGRFAIVPRNRTPAKAGGEQKPEISPYLSEPRLAPYRGVKRKRGALAVSKAPHNRGEKPFVGENCPKFTLSRFTLLPDPPFQH